jgi:hypothetical protein
VETVAALTAVFLTALLRVNFGALEEEGYTTLNEWQLLNIIDVCKLSCTFGTTPSLVFLNVP